MEEFRKAIIKLLKEKAGEDCLVSPKDGKKNNGVALHGICIRRKDVSVGIAVYLDEFFLPYAMGEVKLEEIAEIILDRYGQKETIQNLQSAKESLKDFNRAKEKVRIKLVNYGANVKDLADSPHRKFLDLAVSYYLEVDMPGKKAFTAVTNKMMEKWGITEDDLYGLGMESLLVRDSCFATDMFSMLGEIMRENGEQTEGLDIAGMRMEMEGMGLYVATNRKRMFGASCLLNTFLLQKTAEDIGCGLVIFPCSVHELVIVPQKNGNEDKLDIADIQMLNITQVSKDEWLSNSIYLYDMEKKEVSVYKEGQPFSL